MTIPQLIDKFIEYYILQKHARQSTGQSYRRALEIFFRSLNKSADEITREDINRYIGEKRVAGHKINTQRQHQVIIRMFFHWYSNEYDPSHLDPASNLIQIQEEITIPEIPTPEDIMRLVYVQNLSTYRGRRNAAIISLLADTGIRLSELAQLKVGNVQLRKNHFVLLVPRVKSFERQIPFGRIEENRFTSEYWASYYQEIKYVNLWENNHPLFLNDGMAGANGDRLGYRGVQLMIKKSAERAGINNIHPHTFRHYFATYSVINGTNLSYLKALMGHARMDTTDRYVHIANIISGDILKTTATAGMKAPKEMSGWVKLLKRNIQINKNRAQNDSSKNGDFDEIPA